MIMTPTEATLTFLPDASADAGAFCLVTAPETLGGVAGIGSGAGITGGAGAFIETHIFNFPLVFFSVFVSD